MRNILKIFGSSLITLMLLSTANVYAKDIDVNKKNFPDEKFRSIVKTFDKNKDNKLSNSEIKEVKSLNGTVDSYDDEYILTFQSLKGLEYFYNLESFNCCTDGVKKIDLSSNKKIKSIIMEDATGLTSINIKECKDLKNVYLCSNDLKNLDVSHNVKLESLSVYGKIGSVNLSNNKKLKKLELINNNIKTIDLKNNTALEELNLDVNPIVNLDISKNRNLYKLSVQNCKLSSLNLSKNIKLRKIFCGDDIFKAYSNYDKTYNSIRNLDLSHNKKLLYLYCSDNKIEKLDLSHNKKLKVVYAERNNIKKINLRNLRSVKEIILNNNKLKKISLSSCKNLKELKCDKNLLKSINVRSCKNLEWLSVSGNELRKLDLKNNKKLSLLYFNNNKKDVKYLDLTSNKEMFKLSVRNSNLKKINILGLEKLFEVDLRGNKISKLDLSTNKDIYRLKISGNSFKYLEPGSFYPTEEIMYRMKDDNTLEVYSYNPRCRRHIDIKDTVKINGKNVKVTAIADEAYSEDTNFFRELTIGKYVKSIGKNAFAGCKKIKKITIKSNELSDILEGAFAKHYKTIEIIVNKGYVDYYKNVLNDVFDFNIVKIGEAE